MRFILFVPVVLSLSACGGGSHSRDDEDAGRDAGPMDDAGPDTGPMELDAGMLAPVGAACAFAGDCQGDFCINEGIAPGFVDGYCTGTCDLDADPVEACVMHGGDGFCIEIMPGTGACFDRCDPDAMPSECREPDYLCLEVGGGLGLCVGRGVCGDGEVGFGEECEPPGEGNCGMDCQGTGTAPVGSMCESAADCAGNACIMEFPGGYCTEAGCDLDEPETSCAAAGGDDSVCLPTGEPGMEIGICVDQCDPAMMSADCRPEYECVEIDTDTAICLPRPVCGNGEVERGEECDPPAAMECSDTCVGFGTAPVGDPCESAADCAGDACITEMDGWPGGYCSEADCEIGPLSMSCDAAGGDGICVNVAMMGEPPFGICADRCGPLAPTPDCREGYTCMLFATEMVCAPTGAGGP